MLKLRALGQQPVIQSLNPGEYVPYITYGGTMPGSTTYADVYTPAPPNTYVPLTPEDKAMLAQSMQFSPASVPGVVPPPGQPQPRSPQQAGFLGLPFSNTQILVAGIVGLLIYSASHKG